MIERKYSAYGLCAILLLSITSIPKSARADNGSSDDDRPIHLYATASLGGPIGSIAGSALNPGALIINGRAARDGQMIWAGDMLQSRADRSVPVSLDSVGEVTLLKGAIVKLATRYTRLQDNSERPILIASLVCGDIAVTLKPDACAYLEASGSVFASSKGAAFTASIRDGQPVIDLKSGRVSPERQAEKQAGQHQYTIRPVGHGSTILVNAGSVQQIKVQVLEEEKPMPDIAVMFTLDPAGAGIGRIGLGTLAGSSLTVVTNADGIASVPFTAGHSRGTGTITATIEGTRTAWTGQIRVTSKSIGISKTLLWTVVGVAGAGAAAGIAYAVTRDKDSIQVQPPTVKNP